MPTAAKSPRKKKAATEVDQNNPAEGVDAPVKPKRTRKAATETRIKLYWGVFNQHLKRVAVFDYGDLDKAEQAVEELNKTEVVHFLQKIKETITV